MKKIIIVSILFLSAVSNIFAEKNTKTQEPLTLTVEDAVSYAITNSKSLKSSEIDLEIKKRAKMYSWNVFLPSLSVSGTMSRSNEYSDMMDSIKSAINPSHKPLEPAEINHWKAVGNVSAQLNFNLAMIQSMCASKANYEAGLISWEQTSKQTEMNIRKMFYALLLMEENLRIQNELLDSAEARWQQAEINYKNGLVPQLSALNAQVAYENKKPAILELTQSLKQQKDTFAFLLGIPYGREINLVGSIDTRFVKVDADELVQKYAKENLDVKALQKNIELLKISLNASRLSTFTPSLSVSYGFQPVVAQIDSDWIDTYIDNGSFSATVVIDVMKMMPFSANMQSIKDTKQNLAKAELGLSQLLQNTEIQIHTLVDKLNKSEASIKASQMNIKLAQKAYDMTVKAYNSGTQELLDVKDSENSLSQAKLGLLNEKLNYISALLDLENAINVKLVTK
ncbi:MAG: TolC family protein [Treponema sp.]|nr:TolC family protein [Treponema sp.]